MAYEFKCVHEKDTAPPLDKVAENWFQQARDISKQRLPDWTKVAQLYQQAVDKEHWKAMHNLAELYLRGKGVPKDTNKAIDLYQRMVELNVPLGYYDMGVMVQRGVGVVQSDKDAMLFLIKAADMGSPHAQTRIGYIYVYDKNQDAVGLGYLKCAAEQDFADANYKLATYYEGIDVNIPVAMHYYQRAASLGEPKGALNIRDTFRDGDLQYTKDEKIADEYSEILRRLQDEPGLQIPNLAKEHPLPPHPVQGYHADKDINWKPTGRADDY
ncbi:MAG TPA: sel1 repeat family protein [Pseudomonas oleovorans]|uniref:tetratricopeptide repeat protein n=1 Tax=Ectopseudomonas khazarica TaxID=2502979 RepID=UPI00106E5622|nr:tetratricopeptide repeat protein [Pseudomonas khazarica]HIQ42378.1 sel1 repeat family protein [Pseudomonas oleovorans]